ncbi:hypothetical protein KSP40_PGU017358 [Platanthera guangdongensis]|uniref:Uncharacterized protein n=1 Tax=Platanthera guangdongensis TaxID=2320717 RepID=A0ABR2LQQ6_9ASPA
MSHSHYFSANPQADRKLKTGPPTTSPSMALSTGFIVSCKLQPRSKDNANIFKPCYPAFPVLVRATKGLSSDCVPLPPDRPPPCFRGAHRRSGSTGAFPDPLGLGGTDARQTGHARRRRHLDSRMPRKALIHGELLVVRRWVAGVFRGSATAQMALMGGLRGGDGDLAKQRKRDIKPKFPNRESPGGYPGDCGLIRQWGRDAAAMGGTSPGHGGHVHGTSPEQEVLLLLRDVPDRFWPTSPGHEFFFFSVNFVQISVKVDLSIIVLIFAF